MVGLLCYPLVSVLMLALAAALGVKSDRVGFAGGYQRAF